MTRPAHGRENAHGMKSPHTAGYPDGPRYHRKRYAFFAENIEKVMRDETPEGCLNHVGGR